MQILSDTDRDQSGQTLYMELWGPYKWPYKMGNWGYFTPISGYFTLLTTGRSKLWTRIFIPFCSWGQWLQRKAIFWYIFDAANKTCKYSLSFSFPRIFRSCLLACWKACNLNAGKKTFLGSSGSRCFANPLGICINWVVKPIRATRSWTKSGENP